MSIILSAIILFILDFIYISINKTVFENQIADIQRVAMKLNIYSAIICYIFLVGGLNYFILMKKRSIFDAFLFGLVIYGVYETTNYATFKKWSPYLAIMDTIWGGVLMATTTFIMYKLSN